MTLSVSCQGQGTFIILCLIVSCLRVRMEEGYEDMFSSWYSSELPPPIVFIPQRTEIASLKRETDIFKRSLWKVRPVIYLVCLYRNTLLYMFFNDWVADFSYLFKFTHSTIKWTPYITLCVLPRTSSRRWIQAHAFLSVLRSKGLQLVSLTPCKF